MITRPRTTASKTQMPSLAQGLRYACAANTFLTCAVGDNLDPESPSIFRFVRSEFKELSPASIIDRLRQHSASESLYVQVFDCYQPKIVNQPTTNSVVKIAPLVAYQGVRTLQQDNCLASSIRTFLTPADATVSKSQGAFSPAVISRVRNLRSVAQGRKVSQPHIDPDYVRIERHWLWRILTIKKGKPMSSFALDCQCLDRASKRARDLNSDLPDFRDAQFVSIKSIPDLSKRHAVVSMKRFEARIARFLSGLHPAKECFERQINALQHVLQCVRIDSRNIIAERLDLCKLKRLGFIAKGDSIQRPGVAPFLQRSVIQLAAYRKVIRERLRLALGWVDSIFVSAYYLFGHAVDSSSVKGLVWLGGFASVEPFVIVARFH